MKRAELSRRIWMCCLLAPGMGEAYDKLARIQLGLGLEAEAGATLSLLRQRVPDYKGIGELETLFE